MPTQCPGSTGVERARGNPSAAGQKPIEKRTNPGKLGQNAYCRLIRFPLICRHAKPELA
jgi:hypothetical protein